MRRSAAGNRAANTRFTRIAVVDREGSVQNATLASIASFPALGSLAVALLLLLSPLAAKADPALEESPPAAMMTGADPIPQTTPPLPQTAQPLETLLVVPTRHDHRSDAEIADAEIAAAVERGTNLEFAKQSAFRKRNLDLFRTEREVEIGEQEMLLRLRLRAKSRETMSVELRF